MSERDLPTDPETIYRLSVERLDFRRPDRAAWRAVCTGRARAPMQRFLLSLAEAARVGPVSDRRALLQAAHAVLPLRGPDLAELAALLLEERPVPLAWCDVLVEALAEAAEADSERAGNILDALREMCEEASAALPEQRRVRYILHHTARLGFRPAWLLERLQPDR